MLRLRLPRTQAERVLDLLLWLGLIILAYHIGGSH